MVPGKIIKKKKKRDDRIDNILFSVAPANECATVYIHTDIRAQRRPGKLTRGVYIYNQYNKFTTIRKCAMIYIVCIREDMRRCCLIWVYYIRFSVRGVGYGLEVYRIKDSQAAKRETHAYGSSRPRDTRGLCL